jgi:hypothetical protein
MARMMARLRTPLVTGAVLLVLAAATLAQRGGVGQTSRNPRYDGRFMFARIQYPCFGNCYYYRRLPSWAHGYPSAEENLMKIIDSITDLRPHVDNSVVVSLDDPDLFKYPVSYMTESSFWLMSDKDGQTLRAYLQKGGFIIFDDFRNDFGRGSGGLPNLESNLQRAIPGARLLPMDINHPIFHVFFDVTSFNIIPQAYDYGAPVFLGLYEDNDPHKRLMAIINFNTDISDFWEFTAQGWYPVDSANQAYKLGVNYIIYGMTH